MLEEDNITISDGENQTGRRRYGPQAKTNMERKEIRSTRGVLLTGVGEED
jgi:hypothetical protein